MGTRPSLLRTDVLRLTIAEQINLKATRPCTRTLSFHGVAASLGSSPSDPEGADLCFSPDNKSRARVQGGTQADGNCVRPGHGIVRWMPEAPPPARPNLARARCASCRVRLGMHGRGELGGRFKAGWRCSRFLASGAANHAKCRIMEVRMCARFKQKRAVCSLTVRGQELRRICCSIASCHHSKLFQPRS